MPGAHTKSETVVTVVTIWDKTQPVSLIGDVAMTKAAVLYADRVEVLSLSAVALAHWQAFAPDEEAVIQKLFAGERIDVADLPTFTPQSDRIDSDPGISELVPAFNDGILTINHDVPTGGNMQELFNEFIHMAVTFLYDPRRIVLLDPLLSEIVRTAAIARGTPPPTRAVSNAREAVIGSGLIARLPTFTITPMTELLELRQDLRGPLSRYRTAIAVLQEEVSLDPYVSAREAEVDALWRTRVQTELQEIEDALRTHALVREVARHLSVDVKALMAGAAGGVGVAFAGAHDMAVVTGGAIAAAASIPQAAMAASASRSEIGRRDFYYLYRLGRVRAKR